MKDMGIVQGNTEQAKDLVIGKDTVYVHTDIEPITEDADGNPVEDLYQYHEIQYDKDEYIKQMDEDIAAAQEAIDFLLMNAE